MNWQLRASGSKPALRERGELELAVAVHEHREREERQPVVARVVEGLQDARLVGIAGAARKQLVGLVATVDARSTCGADRPSPTGDGLPRR
jgi:hypothetical protein